MLIYTSVIGQSLTLLLWFYILNKLPIGVASMGTLATPVIGVTAASIQLGERPSVLEDAGTILILSALAILTYHGIRQRSRVKDVIQQN